MSSSLTLPSLDTVDAALARTSLLDFAQVTHPAYEANWHHRLVADALDRVLRGEIRRLMLFMPPQNGKSELVSRRFPAYALGQHPDLRIVGASYNESLAGDMSRDAQTIMQTPVYALAFPQTQLPTQAGRAIAGKAAQRTMRFEVVGRRGYYQAAGIGSSLTGKTADLGIIDDPLKNREEAESATYRERVWNWYTSTFYTRFFGEGGRIVLTMTRWHTDDLAGRLLALAAENPQADQWVVLTLPAIAGTERHPDDPRQPGDPLWPAKYSLEELERRRISSGAYDWSSIYQQSPIPAGGGMFKREWFASDRIVDALPVSGLTRCRFWDCAGTEGAGDWTVGTLLARSPEGIYYVDDVLRVQKSAGTVDALILATAQADRAAYGSVAIREEQEPGSSGKAVIAARTKALAGYDYKGIPASGDKQTRWRPFAVQCEATNVRLKRAAWNAVWLDELTLVPFGKHDDQADSAAGSFAELALGPSGFRIQKLKGF